MNLGALDELRATVEDAPPAPKVLETYLALVHDGASTLTDADVEALKDAGVDEDVIFEQTVAAAIAEGLRRLDAAESVIG